MNKFDIENFLLTLFDGCIDNYTIHTAVYFDDSFDVVTFNSQQSFDRFILYKDGFVASDLDDWDDGGMKDYIIDISYSERQVNFSR